MFCTNLNTKIKKKNTKYFSKKHAEQFFSSNDKKFSYYHKKKRLKFPIEYNENKNNLSSSFEYGVKGTGKAFYFEIRVLVALIKYMRRFSKKLNKKSAKKSIKLRMCVFPDMSLTAKPREIRMGKGKGRFSRKVYFFKKGTKILEFNISSDLFLLSEFMRRCFTRIPCKFEILKKYW